MNKNSFLSDIENIYADLYTEGVIDDSEYLDLISESSDNCDIATLCDDAVAAINALKENPKDKKAFKKVKDLVDQMEDCCEEDDEGEEKEESVIHFNTEDPTAVAIMERVQIADKNLKYVEKVMNSEMMMTESADALKGIFNSVKERLSAVSEFLSKAKKAMGNIKDVVVQSKIAKILADLAKKLTDMLKTVGEKFKSLKPGKGGEAALDAE